MCSRTVLSFLLLFRFSDAGQIPSLSGFASSNHSKSSRFLFLILSYRTVLFCSRTRGYIFPLIPIQVCSTYLVFCSNNILLSTHTRNFRIPFQNHFQNIFRTISEPFSERNHNFPFAHFHSGMFLFCVHPDSIIPSAHFCTSSRIEFFRVLLLSTFLSIFRNHFRAEEKITISKKWTRKEQNKSFS